MRRRGWLAIGAMTLVLATSDGAAAKSRGIKVAFAPDKVSLDGEPNEFDGDWRKLDVAVKGSGGDDDLSAQVLIAHDQDALWVAADVVDDKLVGGADHVELVLGIPGGTTVSFALYPGVPGKSRAEVKSRGRVVSAAKIVEAPSERGYTLEAKLPWSAIPNSATTRVGYRGAVFVHDADSSRSIEQVLGSADSQSYASLPPISMPSELALGSGLLRKRNITQAPKHNLLADVVGDKQLERVLVYDRFLVILGPGYRNGEQYYYRDLGADADDGDLLSFDLADQTGDGLDDVVMRRRVRGSRGAVEVFEVLSYHPGGETPTAVFSHEVRLDLQDGKIDNELRLTGKGERTRIVVAPGSASGFDESVHERVSNTGATPVLLPWGELASQTYTISGGMFVVSDEQTRTPEPAPAAAVVAPAPRPRAATNDVAVWEKPAPGADVSQVYAHYKKQRNQSGAPRFDVSADLAEDTSAERLVVHGLDLVVFGSGFLGGRGFAAVELSHFQQAKDVHQVTTSDVTGDGKKEIVVHGEIRSPLPSDMGTGTMTRDVVIIYKLRGGQFERIFAAELGRRIGDKRIRSKMKLTRGAIVLSPGQATGYDEGTYPWLQKKSPDGGFEPLILPWGGITRLELRYDGEKFVRAG